MDYILETKNLSKSFNETKALNKMNFNLKKGEIHGIIGANGSGKSTFMNTLFGSKIIKDTGGYEGNIYINGEKIKINNTYDAMETGIGMVHQELALLSELDVSSNIKINKENIIQKTKLLSDFALVDQSKNYKDAEDALLKVGIDIDPRRKVKNIPTNLRQFIEIAREIDNKTLKILLLDEPTSSLNLEETRLLMSHIKDLASLGISIIFISHRLEEVVEICDRITILRDGNVINIYNKKDYNVDKLALDMIGKEVVQTLRLKRELNEENILSFKDIEVNYENKLFKDLSLDIKKGEILGITGLAGHGQELFSYGLMGLYDMSGHVIYKGEKLLLEDSSSIIKRGIYLLPDERKEKGLLINQSIWENIIFESYGNQDSFLKYPKLKYFSTLDYKKIDKYADEIINKLNIKVRNKEQKVRELSGGNQQKVCIGRAITVDPEVLFIGEPTRGIDIYSKEIILEILLELNEKNNTSIIISSGELSELKRVCDRIAVMYDNQVFDIFERDFNDEALSLALSGRRVN